MSFIPVEKKRYKSRFRLFIEKLKLAIILLDSDKTILITQYKKNMEVNTVNLRPGEVLQRCEIVYNNVVAEMDVDVKINELVNGE